MNLKKTILIATPNPEDATSFYRGRGPWAAFRKTYPNIECKIGGREASEYAWPNLKDSDLLFLQRPSLDIHKRIIELAKSCNVPVWIDYDDDLFSIPLDNPSHSTYSPPEVRFAMQRCLSLADLVTVSTPYLKERLLSLGAQNVEVLPNAFDDTFLKRSDTLKPMSERKNVVLWRGTNTHQGDLFEFKDAILEAHENHPETIWRFVGWNPWFITDALPKEKVATYAQMMVPDYFNLIKSIQAPIHIVPLKDNQFNRSKSNIAWLEASWAGSAVIAPAWPEWNRPGVLKYEGLQDFKCTLNSALLGAFNLEENQNQSWDSIQKNESLTQVNEKRYSLLAKLLKLN